MELEITCKTLLNAISLVSGAVEKRQTLPILSHVLLKVEKNKLLITATDLELQLMAYAELKSAENATEVTAPARKLMDICRALKPDTALRLSLKGNRLHVTAGKSHFQLAVLPAHEFPNVSIDASHQSFSLPQHEIKQLIEHTGFAMAQQDVRYYLNGMLFELNQSGIQVVATDGHRLALSQFKQNIKVKDTLNVIVPRKAVLELSRLLSNEDTMVDVHVSMNHLHISHPDFQFTSKLIDGKFPDYQRVLPKSVDKIAYLDRDEFKQALVKAAILCNEKFHGVRVTFAASSLQIEANNPEQEQAKDEIPCRFDGDSLELGFNVNYVLDVLNTVPAGEVKLSMSTANASVLFESEDNAFDSVYVIMPMRL